MMTTNSPQYDAAEVARAWPRNENGELMVGSMPLSQAVGRAGGTPCYLYDRAAIERRVAYLRALLGNRIDLHYAIKANPMPALVCHLSRLVDGFDVASGQELGVALDAGMAVADISFAGPGKQEAELMRGLAAGILFNVESLRELQALATMSEATGYAARVALRVNLPFEAKSSSMKMSGGPRQFGIDAEQVPAVLKELAAMELRFEGFHLFAGSQNLKAQPLIEAQSLSYGLVMSWADLLPRTPRILNMGGGFGIPYAPNDKALDLVPVTDHLNALSEKLARDMPGARMAIELGRYLVGEAGLYVSRVIERKVSRGQTFLIVDGGMHQHLAASGNFGQVIRRNYPVSMGCLRKEQETVNVVGPLCTPLDLLADGVEMDRATAGDLFVVFQSGAYGRSASPRDFLGHPDVREALI
ncbi:MAG: pyridoxal-dependent decarboxylase, exosortase A system-associated [Pseudomonadota bacterium]|nr:pyridoxal-dependent decarboxylase, exosortase A system-associated [Pseudomonadota bacterium]